MRIEIITHSSGDQIPLLLDADGLPIPLPNEFILSRRYLSPNTLIRNLRELAVFYRWLDRENIDFLDRLASSGFTEAEVSGSLIEALKRVQDVRVKIKRIAVTPNTFNQRLTTVRQYSAWCADVLSGDIPYDSLEFERLRENKKRLLNFLDHAFVNAPPSNHKTRKGLTPKETEFLLSVLDPHAQGNYGRDPAVKYRNYIVVAIMLFYGLRPGELLSLRVEDIEIGAISSLRVVRRAPDPKDVRRPRPQIKRNGRILPIVDPVFAQCIDEYITHWRDVLEEKSNTESDYLILSDEGKPLSQSSVTQYFQILRRRYSDHLPPHFTAKALRHTFSANIEQGMRMAGVEEQRRREVLATLRGDSSLNSQNVYLAQEIDALANQALNTYQKNLFTEDVPW